MSEETDPEDQNEDANAEGAEGEDGAEGAEGEEGEKKKKPMMLIIIGVVILFLIGAGATLFFTGMLDGLLGKSEATEEYAEGEEGHSDEKGKDSKDGDGKEEKSGSAAFLEIPTIIVNLNGQDGTPRYLRLTVQLELANDEDLAAVEKVIPRVIDKFQTYLRELRVKDLKGSAGIYRLETELLWRVNQAAAPTEIKDVLFQEMLIQ